MYLACEEIDSEKDVCTRLVCGSGPFRRFIGDRAKRWRHPSASRAQVWFRECACASGRRRERGIRALINPRGISSLSISTLFQRL